MFVDENAVLPLSLAKELQSAGFALPLNAPFAYPKGELTLAADNGNPRRAARPADVSRCRTASPPAMRATAPRVPRKTPRTST